MGFLELVMAWAEIALWFRQFLARCLGISRVELLVYDSLRIELAAALW